jgi:hypothetical protein
MPDDISLLPEGMRKTEDSMKGTAAPVAPPSSGSELKFSVPKEESEDIEVIEIDEGEVDQVLASEPPLTRFIYKVAATFDEVKHKLFQPKEAEPAPKLPPQFFTPPPLKTPAVSAPPVGASASVAPAAAAPSFVSAGTPSSSPASAGIAPSAPAKPKTKITPYETVPRRVRVIKRVRKPVRVSFVSSEDIHLMQIDVPKRRFTLILAAVVFAVLIGGGWYFLSTQAGAAHGELAKADAQLADIHVQISQQQSAWTSFQELEPKLKALRTLLDTHISPTRLFDELESHTLPTVAYSSFSLTPDKRVTLLTTADSFQTAAQQVVIFQQLPYVKKVEASSYTAKYNTPQQTQPSGVDFQLVLTLSDDALQTSSTVATAQ